ncbi:hypothetical protein [Winogradskyella aurantia]|uniref:Uncharacterized protein n=1 Tax=Winogradskyella aurantia TaxID=1915063 RepID=A0A265UTE5_9FLAO|nr:hypothetical protein [Winogradskyella aurantia]OZV68492.1 hypothetical protein CA834_08430 [Winogradskyella aurantia]
MKPLLILLSVFLTISINAQDPILQKSEESLEVISENIAKTYDNQIGLDGKQFILFQKKIEEYLIREEKIHLSYSGKKKLDMITKLRAAETMEMRNILTKPQFELYTKLKPEIQPIAVVSTNEE